MCVLFNLVTKALADSARPRSTLPRHKRGGMRRKSGHSELLPNEKSRRVGWSGLEWDRVGQQFVTLPLTNAVGLSTDSSVRLTDTALLRIVHGSREKYAKYKGAVA